MNKQIFIKALVVTVAASVMSGMALNVSAVKQTEIETPFVVRTFDSYEDGVSVGGTAVENASVAYVDSTSFRVGMGSSLIGKEAFDDPDYSSKQVNINIAPEADGKELQVIVDVPEDMQNWSAVKDGWLSFYMNSGAMKYSDAKDPYFYVRLADTDGKVYGLPGGVDCNYKYQNWASDKGMYWEEHTTNWSGLTFNKWLTRFYCIKPAQMKEIGGAGAAIDLTTAKIKQIIFVLDLSDASFEMTEVSVLSFDDIVLGNSVDYSKAANAGSEVEFDGVISGWTSSWPAEEPLKAGEAKPEEKPDGDKEPDKKPDEDKAPEEDKKPDTDKTPDADKKPADDKENGKEDSITKTGAEAAIPCAVILTIAAAGAVMFFKKKENN